MISYRVLCCLFLTYTSIAICGRIELKSNHHLYDDRQNPLETQAIQKSPYSIDDFISDLMNDLETHIGKTDNENRTETENSFRNQTNTQDIFETDVVLGSVKQVHNPHLGQDQEVQREEHHLDFHDTSMDSETLVKANRTRINALDRYEDDDVQAYRDAEATNNAESMKHKDGTSLFDKAVEDSKLTVDSALSNDTDGYHQFDRKLFSKEKKYNYTLDGDKHYQRIEFENFFNKNSTSPYGDNRVHKHEATLDADVLQRNFQNGLTLWKQRHAGENESKSYHRDESKETHEIKSNKVVKNAFVKSIGAFADLAAIEKYPHPVGPVEAELIANHELAHEHEHEVQDEWSRLPLGESQHLTQGHQQVVNEHRDATYELHHLKDQEMCPNVMAFIATDDASMFETLYKYYKRAKVNDGTCNSLAPLADFILLLKSLRAVYIEFESSTEFDMTPHRKVYYDAVVQLTSLCLAEEDVKQKPYTADCGKVSRLVHVPIRHDGESELVVHHPHQQTVHSVHEHDHHLPTIGYTVPARQIDHVDVLSTSHPTIVGYVDHHTESAPAHHHSDDHSHLSDHVAAPSSHHVEFAPVKHHTIDHHMAHQVNENETHQAKHGVLTPEHQLSFHMNRYPHSHQKDRYMPHLPVHSEHHTADLHIPQHVDQTPIETRHNINAEHPPLHALDSSVKHLKVVPHVELAPVVHEIDRIPVERHEGIAVHHIDRPHEEYLNHNDHHYLNTFDALAPAVHHIDRIPVERLEVNHNVDHHLNAFDASIQHGDHHLNAFDASIQHGEVIPHTEVHHVGRPVAEHFVSEHHPFYSSEVSLEHSDILPRVEGRETYYPHIVHQLAPHHSFEVSLSSQLQSLRSEVLKNIAELRILENESKERCKNIRSSISPILETSQQQLRSIAQVVSDLEQNRYSPKDADFIVHLRTLILSSTRQKEELIVMCKIKRN